MLKYVETPITFSEIPSEITLCINISNCPCKCIDCHSSYLSLDIGKELTWESLKKLIRKNKGITCVCFMGGDANPKEVNILAETIRSEYPELKIGWYSGKQELAEEIDLKNFNFIKLGPYNEARGPLNSPKTNQKFYQVSQNDSGKFELINVTYLFWKKNEIKN